MPGIRTYSSSRLKNLIGGVFPLNCGDEPSLQLKECPKLNSLEVVN